MTKRALSGLRDSVDLSQFGRRSFLREFAMSLESHLTELVRRHQAIEHAISSEEASPSANELKVHELKRKKLVLKEEIEKLKVETKSPTQH
jgi:hypothetical protein